MAPQLGEVERHQLVRRVPTRGRPGSSQASASRTAPTPCVRTGTTARGGRGRPASGAFGQLVEGPQPASRRPEATRRRRRAAPRGNRQQARGRRASPGEPRPPEPRGRRAAPAHQRPFVSVAPLVERAAAEQERNHPSKRDDGASDATEAQPPRRADAVPDRGAGRCRRRRSAAAGSR